MNSSQRKRRARRRKQKRLEKRQQKLHTYLNFEYITSIETLSKSAILCERDHKWKRDVQRFMTNRFLNCRELSNQLRNGTFQKRPANHFILRERSKERLISGVCFRDRVVQRAYCDHFLGPIMCDSLLLDNTASQKGLGPDVARNRFALHMRRAIQEYGHDSYMIHYDFRHYFASINPERTMQLIADTAEPLATNDQERESVRRLLDLGRIFICEEEGLGIGNQTSQIMAIAYTSSIDHAIREVCKLGYSGRYMDDGYVFCPDKETAIITLGIIEQLSHELGLTLHPRKTGIEPSIRHHSFLKTVFYLEPNGSIRREIVCSTNRQYRRHYTNIAKSVMRGGLPEYVLDLSEGAYRGISQRASNPDAYNKRMERYFEKTRAEIHRAQSSPYYMKNVRQAGNLCKDYYNFDWPKSGLFQVVEKLST